MRYSKFYIKNFKGINELEIDLEKFPNGKIFPLVGLNESGKTTILEAIYSIQQEIKKEEAHKLIHKNNKSNFGEEILIEAILQIEEEDNELINNFLSSKKLITNSSLSEIKIKKSILFKDSACEKIDIIYDLDLKVKDESSEDFLPIIEKHPEDLKSLLEEIKKNVPRILYFENFLFNFPNRIYLKPFPNEGEEQGEYRKILQDILSRIGTTYNLNKHILDRLQSKTPENEEALTQTINEMCKKLNEIIVLSWESIFKNSTRKSIDINHGNDNNGYYLQFKIKEGSNSFFIDERSLGFRWFFGFLLFTEFRKSRSDEKGEILFLFDEPANNLHQKSQQKLLEIFEKLVDKSKIMYSTHSHHLLSSNYLLTSYIVKDDGIRFKDNGEVDFENHVTDIKAFLYKNFVAKYTDQEDHFKPLLDVLDYAQSCFEKNSKVVFSEGKNDYYIFKWIQKKFFGERFNFSFFPGGGVTNYLNIFREYVGYDKRFISIFDSDREGDKAKKSYIKEISLELERNIFTLKDVDSDWDNLQTEKLFTAQDQIKIVKVLGNEEEVYDKGKFNLAIQYLLINNQNIELEKETLDNFRKIFDFLRNKFDELENVTN